MTALSNPPPSRRRFLRTGLLGAVAGAPLLALPRHVWAAPQRELALDHLHTREQIQLVYARGADYVPEALGRLNNFLRDHYSGAVGQIDPALHDLLHALRRVLATERPFEVISGYRSPATNAHLKATRGGGVATRSLHMDGRAMDVRLPGVALADLRDAAIALQAGGVGYYEREQFVHVDTGRVRRWGG
jgi:uncharacterized protein YcbK (DUF882 family)